MSMHIKNKFVRVFFTGIAYILFDRLKALFFCCAFVILSYLLEFFFHWHSFFSSSGAVVTLAGLFLNIKHALHFHLKLPTKSIYYMLSGKGTFGNEVTAENIAFAESVMTDEVFGVAFMIAGTLIWAYGSYLLPGR